MVYNTSNGHYIQVGIVSGGVSNCGNTDIPDVYVRLDHPEISRFISSPKDYKFEEASIGVSDSKGIFSIYLFKWMSNTGNFLKGRGWGGGREID